MRELIELMVLGQIGVFLHYAKEWVNANKLQKEYSYKTAIPMAILSSITTAVLVYLHKDIEDIYVVTRFGAVVLGYMGNSIFFSFVETKKPKNLPNETNP